MKKLFDNMWIFALLLLVVSMGLSTFFFFAYMKDHL